MPGKQHPQMHHVKSHGPAVALPKNEQKQYGNRSDTTLNIYSTLPLPPPSHHRMHAAATATLTRKNQNSAACPSGSLGISNDKILPRQYTDPAHTPKAAFQPVLGRTSPAFVLWHTSVPWYHSCSSLFCAAAVHWPLFVGSLLQRRRRRRQSCQIADCAAPAGLLLFPRGGALVAPGSTAPPTHLAHFCLAPRFLRGKTSAEPSKR